MNVQPGPEQSGFTMVELIVVMVLVAILAASVLPKLTNVTAMRDQAWHDEAISALRQARAMAMSHRRVVCVAFSNSSVGLTIALTRAAASCAGTVMGTDGSSTYAASLNTTATTSYTYNNRTAGTTTSLGTAATVYFQPDGRATTTFDGSTSARNWAWTIAPSGASSITLEGVSGYAY